MPLPKAGNTTWPPPSPTRDELTLHKDLYAGRTPGKGDEYQPNLDLSSAGSETTVERRKVRVGFAAAVAQKSSSLIYGKGVKLKIPVRDGITEEQAQKTEEVTNDFLHLAGFNNTMNEAGEFCSALSGAFVIMTADETISDGPTYQSIDPSRVDPIFMGTKLIRATFWTDVKVDGRNIWRFVEYRDNYRKEIEIGLYQGTSTSLGKQMPLSSLDETSWLAPEGEPNALTVTSSYPEGVDRMIWYMPNIKPSRRYLSSPQGRSDYQGIESIFIALDLIYTSVIGDVRLGRTRIIAPLSMLSDKTAGANGASWAAEREVFTFLDIDPLDPNARVELMQGIIRSEDHVALATALTEYAARHIGYSPQTFGVNIAGGQPASGVAEKVNLASTISITNTKREYVSPEIADMGYQGQKALVSVWGSDIIPALPVVEWPEIVDDNPIERAEVIDTLVRAHAMSTASAVAAVNPEMTETDIQAEVERILSENGVGQESPLAQVTALAERIAPQ
jgi:hypothetical protein